jgi:iron complex transport system substrate-binding protein
MKRLGILLLLAGCGRVEPFPGPAREVVDWRGKRVRVPDPPRRIVSIVPAATELLFAVGAGDQVVGVTRYCDHPPEAKSRPVVGDLVVDPERLMALRPDLVIGASIAPAAAELEARGYPIFAVDPQGFEDIARALRTLGEVTGHAAEGARAAEAFLARVRAAEAPPGPSVYFEFSSDPFGTTGPESYIGETIRRAGGRNVFEGGWKMVEWEAVLARDPEVILLAHDRIEGLERRAGWRGLRAVKAGRVHAVPKEHYVYPAPRLALGLEGAARLLHAKNP